MLFTDLITTSLDGDKTFERRVPKPNDDDFFFRLSKENDTVTHDTELPALPAEKIV